MGRKNAKQKKYVDFHTNCSFSLTNEVIPYIDELHERLNDICRLHVTKGRVIDIAILHAMKASDKQLLDIYQSLMLN